MNSDENTTRKRRKTLIACDNCRDKKVKCDGQRPVCGYCTKKGWSSDKCIWKYANGFEDVSSTTSIESLQARIRALEAQVESHASPVRTLPGLVHEEGSHRNAGYQTDAQRNGGASAVTAIEGAATGEPQSEGFVGPGSAAVFLSTVRHAVDPEASPNLDSRVWPPASNRDIPNDYVLPSQREADALFHLYWTYVHPLYPFVYKPAFQKSYIGLRSGEMCPTVPCPLMCTTKSTDVALVNLVLALSYQYSHKHTGSDITCLGAETAEEHFGRAQRAFQYDYLDGTEQTLQAVQVILLMAQYLSSIGRTHRAWEAIGTGVRTCYRLGLHRSQLFLEHANLTEADQEMIKRVWHGCIMVER